MVENEMTLEKTEAPADGSGNGALLSIQNLHVWFELKRWGFAHAGYVRAVDDVSFDLMRGDAIAIVGESGSGKTSLMKTILGLNRPIKGDIIFDGQNLSQSNARETREYRSKIGFVQQDPYGALPPFMNVQRILAEPLIVNGIKDPVIQEERIRRVMDEVKLNPVDDFIDKFPHMLSGGQQQRVVIARAMILEPKLIVADEPVSGSFTVRRRITDQHFLAPVGPCTLGPLPKADIKLGAHADNNTSMRIFGIRQTDLFPSDGAGITDPSGQV